jgi:hypothetical protein
MPSALRVATLRAGLFQRSSSVSMSLPIHTTGCAMRAYKAWG